MLRLGEYDLDVERAGQRGPDEADEVHTEREAGARYQELLYEASRFDLCEGVVVQVASPEDLEHYSHLRRTGTAPEFRVSRNAAASEELSQPETDGDRADL